MAKEETVVGDILILVPSIFWDVGISETPKRAKVADVRLPTIEGLEWGATSKGRGWQNISDVSRVEDCPTPEGVQEPTQVVSAESAGNNCLVAIFSYTILLGCIRHGGFMFNAVLSEVE
jgi:hypothetical protein